ncbi:MAG: hypothetical protein KDA81_20965, partial [Planctomycetaceae bacterium]|nr:hypothetical protein [Planctomycetaceae bacterium]
SVTVEPGSSGEPVVDRQGRVIGIVTMKSTQQSNLGFALPVRHLKTLLENPSPIPIERWMTIGALDASQWSILYGANWRQRASRILVDGYGDSFGGRSLCLKPAPEPDKPFEIQVDVRLDDESGAAGLAFHSDGAHRHYGFYPSAGKLRLTRFNGPDLNSWTILHNEAHPAWRAGEWNTIKVRLEDERFLCYLNDQLVVESKDALIPSGQCGLATFRGTSASFRRFQVADSIPSRHPSPEEAIAIADILSQLQTNRPPTEAAIEQLLPFRDRTSLVLAAEARRLEQRSQRLRQLAKDVHAAAVRKQLLSALGRESADKIAEPAEKPVAAVNAPEADAVETSAKEPDLLKAALLIARLDNEEVDPDVYVERVDRLAAEVRQTLPADASEADRLKALDQMLFREYGFRGSQFEYYTTSNSYLNEVIDDREGLPITLSVLYIELAKRLDLNVVGLGLPGHYVVRFEPTDDGRMQIIDVYNRGERISQQEAESLITARGFPQRPEFFEGQPPVKIVERMLLNLLGLAEGRRDDEGVLRYLETLALLDDQNLEYRAKRLEMRARTERLEEAIADADWFIERDPGNADRLYELRAELQRSLDARTTETGLQGLRPTP